MDAVVDEHDAVGVAAILAELLDEPVLRVDDVDLEAVVG